MSDDSNSSFGSSDYAVIAITAAVAGVTVSYPKQARALYVIDDIAIGIANGIAEMYRIASEQLAEHFEEREKTADEMKQFAFAKMGDAINAVKTATNNQRRVNESQELASACLFRDGASARLRQAAEQSRSPGAVADLNEYLTKSKLAQSSSNLTVPDTSDPVNVTVSISAPFLLSVQGAVEDIKERIEDLSIATSSYLTRIPYALSTTSHIDFVLRYREQSSHYAFINSMHTDTNVRLRSVNYYDNLYGSNNQSAAMHDYLFNIGKEASHWLEMYRQNEMLILSLVQRLVIR